MAVASKNAENPLPWTRPNLGGRIPRRRFHRELRQVPAVDAPPRHRGNTHFNGLLAFRRGEGRGEPRHAVLRRRSAVLVTRSANCEQRKRL